MGDSTAHANTKQVEPQPSGAFQTGINVVCKEGPYQRSVRTALRKQMKDCHVRVLDGV